MRKILSIWTLLSILLVVGCESHSDESDEAPSINNEVPHLEVDSNFKACYLQPEQTKVSISFTMDADWEIRFSTVDYQKVDWVTASPSSGEAGTHTVEITLPENRTLDNKLVRVEIYEKIENSRFFDFEFDTLLNHYQGLKLTASILQFAYYDTTYGDPIRIKVKPGASLSEQIDAYLKNGNKTYDDVIYIKLLGHLVEEDYEFIREKLTRLKVLDMFESDVIHIPASAFMRHTSLHYIVLPYQLKSIADYAFCQSGLKNINLYMPPLLESVGWNAFADTQIAGSVMFFGFESKMHLSGGAFSNTFITSAIFCNGIHSITGDIASPFDKLNAMVLPPTLDYITSSYISNSSVIFCYAEYPPTLSDVYAPVGKDVGFLLVPKASGLIPYNRYQMNESGYGWGAFYVSYDPELPPEVQEAKGENRLFPML